MDAMGHNYQCTADFENVGVYLLFVGKLFYGTFLWTFGGDLDIFDPSKCPLKCSIK